MEDPPHEFRCAITLEIMDDPAVTDDGHVYERRVIQKWFDSGKRTSPVTNKILQSTTLRECIPLRNLIADWKAKQGLASGSAIIPTSSSNPSVPQASHEDVLRVVKERTQNEQGRDCKIKGTLHKQSYEHSQVFVRIVPPKLGTRRPASFVCVVDVSGSMNISTEPPNPGETAFTRMNLVVHSIRAFAQTLLDEDILSLVTFGSTTRTVLDNVQMTPQKRQELERILDNLRVDGSTDMMGGLKEGIRLTRQAQETDGRPTFIIFLTDGDATTQPTFRSKPFANFTRALISQAPFTAAIHTFGYGYELDSRALYDISQVGGGVFSFIPDSTMVGTAMVNVFSASSASVFSKVRVRITSNTPIVAVEGYDIDADRPNLLTVDIEVGSVQFGQTRDLLVKIENTTDYSTPVVFLEAFFDADTQKAHDVFCVDKYDNDHELDVERTVQEARFKLINTIKNVLKIANMDTIASARANAKKYVHEKSLQAAKAELDSAYQFISRLNESSAAAGDERLESMLSDIHNDENENVGQIGKAISKPEWFIKWGNSYLISLLTALQQQICHNFKDKSVQSFGGPLFEKLQEKAQTAFCTLPPPRAGPSYAPSSPSFSSSSSSSISSSSSSSSSGSSYQSSYSSNYTPPNMANYYYAHGGCVHGQGLVKVAPSTPNSISSSEGFFKRVENIRKNDIVILADGSLAAVLCVVETVLPHGAELVQIGNLKLTPFHPVLITDANGVSQWQFPIDVPQSRLIPFSGTVYDFVLERGHSVNVDGIECITLGHGLTDNAVVSHPYYGTQKVVEDLQKLSGWGAGRVLIHKLNRDPETKLVIGIEAQLSSSLYA